MQGRNKWYLLIFLKKDKDLIRYQNIFPIFAKIIY